MTHTFSLLEVSHSTYDEIESLLREAGYGHAFIENAIDMHGIALTRAVKASSADSVRCDPDCGCGIDGTFGHTEDTYESRKSKA